MPGTITVRPLSANLTRDTEVFGTMDPYCRIILGHQKVSGEVCTNGGKHPHWEDTIVVRRINEAACQIEVKEKDWLLPDSVIGTCDINLQEVVDKIRVLKWHPLIFKEHSVGKILVEISYEADHVVESKSDKKPVLQQTQPEILNEIINLRTDEPSESKPQEGKNAKTFIKGLIHGWNPFGGKAQKNQAEPSQASQSIPVPNQQIHGYNPLAQASSNENFNQNNNIHQNQSQKENIWAPSYPANPQQDQFISRKYPELRTAPIQYSNYNGDFSHCNYPNLQNNPQESREQYSYDSSNFDYGNQQHNPSNFDSGYNQANSYAPSNCYNNYEENNNPSQNYPVQNTRFDPLRVIRGA